MKNRAIKSHRKVKYYYYKHTGEKYNIFNKINSNIGTQKDITCGRYHVHFVASFIGNISKTISLLVSFTAAHDRTHTEMQYKCNLCYKAFTICIGCFLIRNSLVKY